MAATQLNGYALVKGRDSSSSSSLPKLNGRALINIGCVYAYSWQYLCVVEAEVLRVNVRSSLQDKSHIPRGIINPAFPACSVKHADFFE